MIAERVDQFPLALNQVGVWTAQQVAPESHALHAVLAIRLGNELDIDALREAFKALARRYPALRTTFHAGPEQPCQRVHDDLEVAFEYVDAAGCSEEALRERVLADGRRPFDLSRGCHRFIIYRRAPDDHVLCIGLHHIGNDLVSTETYLRELPELYEGALLRRPSPPPSATRLRYSSFVEWQAAFLASPDAERSFAVWEQRLRGAPTLLDLPLDHPRPPVRLARGESLGFELPPELVGKLRRHGKSLNRTLFAAFQVLLFRYTGQADLLTGMPADLRPSREYLDVTGNFVNMLVIRIDMSGDPSVRELAERVDAAVSEAVQHRHIPLPLIVERLRPRRDPSATPFFQVAMGLQRMPSLPALGASMVPGASWTTNFGRFLAQPYALLEHEGQYDLSLIGGDTGRQVPLALKYNTDLFERSTIERMASNFCVLAEAMADSPSTRIGSLPVMTSSERRRVLVEWNETSTLLDRERCIHDLVVEAARRDGGALAVASSEARLTYRELVSRSASVAMDLRRRGVGRNGVVAVVLERSVDAILAMLATLRAGGAYLPIDPRLPAERMATILKEARPKAVIARGAAGAAIRGIGLDPFEIGDSTAHAEIEHVNDSNDLAYVIYTSGSTGTPKGVQIRHLGLVNNCLWTKRTFEIGPGMRVAQVIALGFDGSVLEIWPALAAGASLHLVDERSRATPSALTGWMRQEGIQFSVLPTPLAEMFLEADAELPDLRAVLAGGDKLHVPKRRPRFRLFNGYGPTESTVITTYQEVLDGPQGQSVPIGRPVANTRVYVLDEQLEPVPIGARGELCVGGITVARGYLNRPDLEADKFVPDRLSSHAGDRLYRTGDLVRYRSTGVLEFAGRIDHQVKLRGFRIELGEIENVLRQQAGVAECVVILREVAGTPNLVAYVVGAVDRSTLQASLSKRLPEYMVPAFFVRLDALPLTSIGKIDHGALPEPTRPLGESICPPASSSEERMLRLWRGLLRVDAIGVTQDFFELGGDSLLAMRLASEVKREFDKEILVSDILRQTTIRGQVALLEGAATGPDAAAAITLHEGGDSPPVWLVHTILGSVVPYRALAHSIGSRSAIGLTAPARAVGEDMERIASSYLPVLRARQPNGPYVLCGWSWAGSLALEMARQLRDGGAHVALLALIDAPHPEKLSFPLYEAGLVGRFFSFFTQAGTPWSEYLDLTAEDPLGTAFERLQALGVLPPKLSLAQLRPTYESFRAYAIALHRYHPAPWHAPTLFLRATLNAGRGAWGATMRQAVSLPDWRHVCRQLVVEDVEADHFTILGELLSHTIGGRLTDHIARALGQRPGRPPDGLAAGSTLMTLSSDLERMSSRTDDQSWRPLVLDVSREGTGLLEDLIKSDDGLIIHDGIRAQVGELIATRSPVERFTAEELDPAIDAHFRGVPPEKTGTWVYFPWSRRLVHTLAEADFHELRFNRNRQRITAEEQERLRSLRIGVVGLSVGASIAETMVQEGVGGSFRLADFGKLTLSNTNRVRGGLADLGVEKTVLTARRMLEADPFLDVDCFASGVTFENIDDFFAHGGSLDAVIEASDHLPVAVAIREHAAARRIPFFSVNAWGQLRIDRFDREDHRPVNGGGYGSLRSEDLRRLPPWTLGPMALTMAGELSPRELASAVQIGRTLSGPPQLSSISNMAVGVVVDAVRRSVLGQSNDSGCYRVTPELALRREIEPASVELSPEALAPRSTPGMPACRGVVNREVVEYVVAHGVMAPSGSNIQPWRFRFENGVLSLRNEPSLAFEMIDLDDMATWVSFGAVVENMVLAAHSVGLEPRMVIFPDQADRDLVCRMTFEPCPAALDPLFDCMAKRTVNRRVPNRHAPLDQGVRRALLATAEKGGAKLQLLTDPGALTDYESILAAGDRISWLNKNVYKELVSCFRFTRAEVELTRDGLDVATLELERYQRAGLEALCDRANVDAIKNYGGSSFLEQSAEGRVSNSSALALLTTQGFTPTAILLGGRVVQRLWLTATAAGLALQPLTFLPYFLMRVERAGGRGFERDELEELSRLRERYKRLFQVGPGDAEVFMFRLAEAEPPTAHALRRRLEYFLSFDA